MYKTLKGYTIKTFISLITLSIFLATQSGCALKEEVIYAQQVPAPKATIKPKIITQKAPIPVRKTIIKTTPQALFANAKTMKFPTLNHKTITIKAQDNLLKITNPEYQNVDVVLYLFGRDCVHCRNEIAQVRKLAKKRNLKIIGVHAQKMIGDGALKSYAKKVGFNFDILSFQNDVVLLKYLDKSGLWGGGTPTHLLIDSGGNVFDKSLSSLQRR